MTQMTMNPLMVGLVQAAAALPVFPVILPAGAVAKRIGVPNALGVAAVVLALGALALRGHRITANELELAPVVVRD